MPHDTHYRLDGGRQRLTIAFVGLGRYSGGSPIPFHLAVALDDPEAELEAYADLTYTRARGPGDNPKTAVHEFLKTHSNFEIDSSIDHTLLVSVAPDGYLRRLW